MVQSLVARAQPHELAAVLGAPAPHVPVGMLHKTMGGTCTYLLAAAEQKWRDEEEAAAAAPAAAPAAEKAARREREVVEAREVAKRLGEHAAAQAKKAQAVLLGCRSALRRLRRVLSPRSARAAGRTRARARRRRRRGSPTTDVRRCRSRRCMPRRQDGAASINPIRTPVRKLSFYIVALESRMTGPPKSTDSALIIKTSILVIKIRVLCTGPR